MQYVSSMWTSLSSLDELFFLDHADFRHVFLSSDATDSAAEFDAASELLDQADQTARVQMQEYHDQRAEGDFAQRRDLADPGCWCWTR